MIILASGVDGRDTLGRRDLAGVPRPDVAGLFRRHWPARELERPGQGRLGNVSSGRSRKRKFGTLSIFLAASLGLIGRAAGPVFPLKAGEAGAVVAKDKPWFEHSLVGMEVGPTGAQFGGAEVDKVFARNFNGREIVRKSLAAHSQYLVIWARDGEFAYYNSKLLPKPGGLGERDVLREAGEEGHRNRLPILAYCQLQYPSRELREHPDWAMRDHDGKPIAGRVCFNSPYTNVVKQLLTEMLAYGIDGFHLDMVDQGFGAPYGCWCEHCRKRFEAEYGRPMPKDVTWDEDWDRMLEFRYQTSDRFEKMLFAHVKSIRPDASVDFNYHGSPPFSWEVGQRPVQHADNADFVTGETGQWAFSALGVGLNAEFYRAATPGRPYQVAMQRGVRMYHDQTTRPLNDMRWELFTLLAHGAFVTMVDKTGYDGWLDPVAYDRIGAAFQEARAKREQFGQGPVYDVGLYFSARTRDWYARDKPAKYFQSFQGAQKACAYEHLTFGVLFDESVTLERLKAFPVVCLPNTAILSDGEIALFRRYVEEGGQLLVTGQSGQYDRMGRPRDEPALAALLGAKVAGRLESTDNWIRLSAAAKGEHSISPAEAKVLLGKIPANWPFLVEGPATVYEPTAARTAGELMKPYRTLLQREGKQKYEWPLSAEAPVGPAVLLNRIGSGRVLTLAGSPDFSVAGERHIIEARKLFRNAVRFLHPNPRVQVSAPANVETVISDDPAGRTLRVHFIAYNSLPQTTPARDRPFVLPGLMEDAPIFEAKIQTRDRIKSAKAWNATTRLETHGNEIQLTIHDVHEVIRLRY
jgi:Hypothetical glycosyl hydrolase 6